MTVSFDREIIPAATMGGERLPDENWELIDAAGHVHAWRGKKLPTLRWVKTGTRWVGDDYDACEYDVGEYRCRRCGEVVEPRYTWRSTEGDFILGPAVYMLSVKVPPFGVQEIHLTQEEVVECVGLAGDQVAFYAWVDRVRERWMDMYAT